MSGLSASMWTAVSGLKSHGNKMNVVGNNIANVSTIGFKGQRMDFCDYLYTSAGSASGPTQIGAGVNTYAVLGDFSQGTLESTNSGTDLGIDGNGFFKVRKPLSDQMYYSRAGDFYFDNERQLINPQGMILQGWKVDNSKTLTFNHGSTSLGNTSLAESSYVGSGTPVDIVLDTWNLPPQQTRNVLSIMQLTNKNADKTTSATSPMAALWDQWDGTNPDAPLADNAYCGRSDIKVYDEGGNAHDVSVFYDKVETSTDDYTIEGLPSGYTIYEYLVTIPPSEDNRTYGGDIVGYDAQGNPILDNEDSFKGTKAAGILMSGQLIFNASGQLVNQTAFTYGANGLMADGTPMDPDEPCDQDPTNMASWQPTKTSSNGLPVFSANFTGRPLANSVSETAANGGTPYSIVENYVIELDLGLKNTANPPWTDMDLTLASMNADAATGIIDFTTQVPVMDSPVRQPNATVVVAKEKSTVQSSKADGYPAGLLSSYQIDENGIVYGYYDNSETLALYQIALYDFDNYQGLYREGNNLYSATKESGDPRQGVANDGGFGKTVAYSIEGSNVDMTTEFVQMITTQRGFQANSKGITTVDTMLETVIGMKR